MDRQLASNVQPILIAGHPEVQTNFHLIPVYNSATGFLDYLVCQTLQMVTPPPALVYVTPTVAVTPTYQAKTSPPQFRTILPKNNQWEPNSFFNGQTELVGNQQLALLQCRDKQSELDFSRHQTGLIRYNYPIFNNQTRLPWLNQSKPNAFNDQSKITSKSDDNNLLCETCNKKFCNSKYLRVHKRLHTGERPFACEFSDCDKKFISKGMLKQHFNTHSVNVCTDCGKKFSFFKDLRVHLETHSCNERSKYHAPRNRIIYASRIFDTEFG